MIGDRIKERRIEMGLTQAQLSKLTGIKSTTISNYENNISSPNEENIFKFMEVLKCDANYLFEWDENHEIKLTSSERKNIKKYRALDTYGKKSVDDLIGNEYERCKAESRNKIQTLTFRRFSANKASAGSGYDLSNADEWREITVIDTPEAREADFAVEVDGHSMEPTYHDGDIVYIVVDSNVPVGSVGLFIQDGCGYIKEAGRDRLISHNSDYDDIYPKDGEIKCVGRVIGIAEFL